MCRTRVYDTIRYIKGGYQMSHNMGHKLNHNRGVNNEALTEFDDTVSPTSAAETDMSTAAADALATAQFGGSIALTGFQPTPETQPGQTGEAPKTAAYASSFNSSL